MNAHKTARVRKVPSVPMRRLDNDRLLRGRLLDYGCGRGFDAWHFSMDKYDPHFAPEMPEGLFDTITCTYVLNVIESRAERFKVLKDIKSRLTPSGIAYITVRNDVGLLNGRTSRGAWQGLVQFMFPKQYENSSFITYIMT